MAGPNVCKPPKSLHGYGAYLRRYDPILDTWITIGGLVDIPIPSEMVEKIESNDDDGDGTVHYIPSPQIDVEDMTFSGDYIDSEFVVLRNIMKQKPQPKTCFQVVLNTPKQRYFEWCAYIQSIKGTAQKKGLVTKELTLFHAGGGVRTGELI